MEKLSGKQVLVISHLLSSPSIERACKKAKIGRTTFYEWLKDKNFRVELKRQRDEVVNQALETLKFSLTKAVKQLVELMDSKKEMIRRWASKDVIDYSFKAMELQDFEGRLEKIERIILERRTYK